MTAPTKSAFVNVLLSHTSEETRVASVLQHWIESSLDRDVHASGEGEEVQLDEERLAEVDGVLSEAQIVLLLCSNASIGRPWINFEAGCAWFKGVPLLAVCHCGCSPAELPPPLGNLEAFDLTDAASCQALMETLAEHVQRKRVPRIDGDLMVAELKAAMNPGDAPEPVAMRPRKAPKSAPAPPVSKAKPKSIEVRLLATIKRLPDYTCTATGLAAELGEQERRMRLSLDKLVSNQLLIQKASTHPTDPETRYALTNTGREYLAKHDR
jgi:hypothetical protein